MAFDATFSPYCHASFDFPSGNEFSTRAWCVPTADLSAHDRRRDEASGMRLLKWWVSQFVVSHPSGRFFGPDQNAAFDKLWISQKLSRGSASLEKLQSGLARSGILINGR